MIAVTLDGIDKLDAALQAYPDVIRAALAAKADILASALVDNIRNDKLSGQVLQSRSGALAASLVYDIAGDADAITATVGSEGVAYAAIQEYGGKTAAHEIVAVKGAALAFLVDGALHFARKIEHPGSAIPERSYLRSSLEDFNDTLIAEFSDAAVESWETS